MDYKTVLVIGNGFDLNLGLKTSYDDFMNSEEFSRIKDSSLVTYLKKKKGRGFWVDIENEMSSYSYRLYELFGPIANSIRDKGTQIQKLKSEYIELCAILSQYLRRASAVEITCLKEKDAFKTLSKIKKLQSAYILNFNYTNTIERINDFYPTDGIEINHIHGSLNSNIVFGVEDTAKVEKEHVFLYKSYNQFNNIKGLHSIFDNADSFMFFGYSLGQTDHSYFDDFFKAQTLPNTKKRSFIFYHYGQESYDDLIWQLKVLTGNRLSYLKNYNDIKFIDVKH